MGILLSSTKDEEEVYVESRKRYHLLYCMEWIATTRILTHYFIYGNDNSSRRLVAIYNQLPELTCWLCGAVQWSYCNPLGIYCTIYCSLFRIRMVIVVIFTTNIINLYRFHISGCVNSRGKYFRFYFSTSSQISMLSSIQP